jgi:predicted RNA binding protein YcfA (HicA-like mRNA interferase family)
MSRKEKLKQGLLSNPSTFKWDDLCVVLKHCDFDMLKGRGSRRKFVHKTTKKLLIIHEPHPSNEVKLYSIKDAVELLKELNYE